MLRVTVFSLPDNMRVLRKLSSRLPDPVRRQVSVLFHSSTTWSIRGGRLILASPRITKSLVRKSLCRSDYKRWTDPHSLEEWWDSRTEQVASLIPGGTRVIEFGAGRRQLEKLLDKDCSYIPSDLADRGPGTLILDLNHRPLPDLRHLEADIAVFAGVLEYIRDVEFMVNWLSRQVSLCIASYAYVQPTGNIFKRLRDRLDRAYYGYMNGYTEEQLVHLFEKYGFNCTTRETWTNQRIFVFTNRSDISTQRIPTAGLT
jgi:hypothetical protein